MSLRIDYTKQDWKYYVFLIDLLAFLLICTSLPNLIPQKKFNLEFAINTTQFMANYHTSFKLPSQSMSYPGPYSWYVCLDHIFSNKLINSIFQKIPNEIAVKTVLISPIFQDSSLLCECTTAIKRKQRRSAILILIGTKICWPFLSHFSKKMGTITR